MESREFGVAAESHAIEHLPDEQVPDVDADRLAKLGDVDGLDGLAGDGRWGRSAG